MYMKERGRCMEEVAFTCLCVCEREREGERERERERGIECAVTVV